MLTALALLAMQQGQRPSIAGLRVPEVKETYMLGQREVVLGPLLQADTVMSVIHSKYLPGTLDENGLTTTKWDEAPIGTVRWSVTDGTLFEQPCRIIRISGMTRTRVDFKRPKTSLEPENNAVTIWYVSPDGRILRQYESREGYSGTKTANCTYGPDSIQVQVEDGGQRKVTTVYPSIEMEDLNRQFRPMLRGDQVLMSEKEYYVYDPFNGGFQKWKAKLGGAFNGTWAQIPYKGRHWEVSSPTRTVRAYISNQNELVKVDLLDDDYIVRTGQTIG